MTDTETEQAPNVFTFRAALLPEFEARLAKLVKVAEKLSVPPITFEVIAREVREIPDYLLTDDGNIAVSIPLGTFSRIEYVTIRTQGETPTLPGGWSFLGAIEHLDGGNLIHGEHEALAKYRTASADCVHCGYKRNRRKTIVCVSADGELAQIGTACVKDFLGYHGNPERLVSLLESFAELAEDMEREEYGGMSGYEIGTPTDAFLSAVCACVRTHGWIPKSLGRGTPTAVLVSYVLGLSRIDRRDSELKRMVDAVQITDEDKAEALSVREFALSIDPQTPNNYLGNVRVSLAGDHVLSRHFGIAASAIVARRTDEEKKREREERDGLRKTSAHFGTIGERITLPEVTVTFVRSFETDYGTKYLVEMTTQDGNIAKSFSTGKFGWSAKRGDVLTIKGTVSEHEDYKGTLGTLLKRVTILTNHAVPCGDPVKHAHSACDCPADT